MPISKSEMTLGDLEEAENLRKIELVRLSSNSLEAYLANITIDSRPEPVPWHQIIEPWQTDLVKPLIPAIEQMAGLRSDYTGPRKFWLGLSKGHDKTGLVARICNWACGFSKHRIKAIAAAGDKEQAGLILESLNAEWRLNLWLQDRITVKGWSAVGPGGELDIVSSDAPSASGEKPDLIVCDEVTFWKKRDLWDMLYAATEKRPDCVFIVITNAGLRDSWQDELRKMARMNPHSWFFFESPVGRTLASWMTPTRIEEMRKGLLRGFARRVLDNVWIDSTENPLLSEELILQCENGESLWPTYYTRFGYQPDLYVGIDVGRKKDLTVIWTLELVEVEGVMIAYTRWIDVLEKKPFRYQKQFIKERLTRNVIKCNIDMGGIGYQLAEELTEEYPHKVEGVALGGPRQGQMALTTKSYFESQRIQIPSDPVLRLDLQQVSEAETAPGGVPIIKTALTDVGHADRFWAMALAILGLPVDTGPRYHRPPKGVKSRFAAAIR